LGNHSLLKHFCHREHGEKRAFLGALCEFCGKIDEDRDKAENFDATIQREITYKYLFAKGFF